MGLSIRSYAKHRGVSDKAVRKAIQSGRIAKAVLPDKSIDPALADRLWEANTDPVQRRGKEAQRALKSMAAKGADPGPQSGSAPSSSGSAPETEKAAASVTGSAPPTAKPNRPSDNVVHLRLAEHARANRAKARPPHWSGGDDGDGEDGSPEMLELALREKAQKVRKLEIENDAKQGLQVPKAETHAHFFEVQKATSDSWSKWATKYAPDIGAEFGIEDTFRLRVFLDDLIRKEQAEQAAALTKAMEKTGDAAL